MPYINAPGISRFQVEIARTPEELRKGLSDRPYLAPRNGMLFIFSKTSIQSMWMPSMNFPLDIVWLDGTLKIVSIRYDCEPCSSLDDCPSISSIKKCQHAIEFAAGEVKALGFREGDRLKLR